MKLEYGCGYWNLKKGWKNADTSKYRGVNYVIDEKTSRIHGLRGGCCNVIRARNVLHHIKQMAKVFGEINRLLKKKGKVIISEPRKECWLGNVSLDIWWYRIKIPRFQVWFALRYRDWKHFRKELGYSLIKKYDEGHNEVEVWQKN